MTLSAFAEALVLALPSSWTVSEDAYGKIVIVPPPGAPVANFEAFPFAPYDSPRFTVSFVYLDLPGDGKKWIPAADGRGRRAFFEAGELARVLTERAKP